MKHMKTLLASAVAASTFAAAPVAMAEIGASVGVASTYLWRGYDLGSGTPAVSGDLNYSVAGFYTGIWGSSGDTAAGTEYDLYAGYGMSLGEVFSFDISVWNYNYPTGAGYRDDDTTNTFEETDFGDLTDAILTIGVGPVSFSYYQPVAGDDHQDYNYYTLSAGFGAFSFTLGMHDYHGKDADGKSVDDPVHLNIDYAYNDNLTFTLSQFIADEDGGDVGPDIDGDDVPDGDDDLKFVVSYSIPLM